MISIVIPALNEERLLPDCLRSVLNQDYCGEYEVVVVDNGSTDNTRRIAEGYGVRVIDCLRRGIVYARQAGAEAACGTIVIQADADTIYPHDWLSGIIKDFDSHPKAVAVAGRYKYYSPPFWAPIEYSIRHLVNLLCLAALGKPTCISGANFAFTRRAFFEIGGYRVGSRYTDQFDIARRLSTLGKVIYDSKLIALTSSRRVQKPPLRIIAEAASNIVQAFIYGASYELHEIQVFSRRPLKNAAKFLPPALILGVIAYGYFVPTSQVFGKVYYKGKVLPPEKPIALTFDDGPNEPYTSEVLDILDKYGIKATFFLIGKNVALYPDTARRIVKEGHAIGNHSYSHDANHAVTDEGVKDLRIAQEVISRITGVEPQFYRPPHGRITPWESAAAREEGMSIVTWSVSANELSGKSAEELAKEIVSRARPGGIILLHDGYGTLHNQPKSDKSITVKALPIIIESLQKEGYEFVTIPELFDMPPLPESTPPDLDRT